MKKKNLLKSIILPLLFVFSPSIAMPDYIHTILGIIFAGDFEQRQKHREQRQKRKEQKNKFKQHGLVSINHEINTIKNEYYKKILNELHIITGESYDSLKKEVDEQRTLAKTLLQQENCLGNHDPNMPHSISQKLYTAIEQHNINPNNIDFSYNNCTGSTLATAYGGLMYSGSWIFKPKIIVKPEITIYDSLLKKSEDYQIQTCHHEISHILLQHKYIKRLAFDKLPCITLNEPNAESYTPAENYYKKKNISLLASLIEEEADMNASLINSQIAYTGMQQRCSYSKHSYILDSKSHCEQLENIYYLIKQKEKLS